MQNWLSIGVIVFSGGAAFFWFVAAFAWVNSNKEDKPGADGYGNAKISDDGVDVVATARRQTYWSRFAALSACLAAICQVVLAYKFGKL